MSLDSKYSLALDFNVVCLTNYPASKKDADNIRLEYEETSDKRNENDSCSESSGSATDDDDVDNDDDDDAVNEFNVSVNKEVAALLRTYIGTNAFLELIDDATTISMEEDGHAPGTELVFDTLKTEYNDDTGEIYLFGKWKYILPKVKRGRKNRTHGHNGEPDHQSETASTATYKTEEDGVSFSTINEAVKTNLLQLSDDHEFVISNKKQLYLKINNVSMNQE